MSDERFPETWAPYMTWAKHKPRVRHDLTGSNMLPCTLDDLPGARDVLRLDARNDDGWPPLVDAIARRFGVDAERVTTAPGASGANFMALGALLRPGDRVLVEWPGYDPHAGAARLLGARVSTFGRGWDRRFRLDPDAVAAALTPDTRAIVLSNLHNPSGAYAEPDALLAVGELAESVDAKVLVDEVYLDVVDGLDRSPAATRSDTFISTSSLTKSYGLSGLRIGWILADAGTIERCRRVRDVLDAVGPIPTAALGELAFRQMDELLSRARGILAPNVAVLREFMAVRNELDWIEPVGGSVAFPRLLDVEDAEPFVDMARETFGVAATPGRLFGAPAHFRVALAVEADRFAAALEALGSALDRR
jgi:aspartate/methionine/tyrosine aminotransferase